MFANARIPLNLKTVKLSIISIVITILISPAVCLGQAQPWYTQTNIYQVFVEKFTDSKNLAGVKDNLNYLQDLGVKTIWLMPIFEAMDDHGYNATNYYKIASRYGSEQDLKDLVKAAHDDRKMHVILDLVINHTGTQNPWFASSNPTVRKDNWYIWADKDLCWDDPWNSNSNTGQENANKTWFKDPFADYDRNGNNDAHDDDYYYSVFGDGVGETMPDLNYNDPVARNEIIAEMKKIMDYWIKNTGVDGFRCDAVRYLAENGPGIQSDQPETHAIWKELRKWLDANHPGVILLAEAPTEDYDQMIKYYGRGDEFHSAFHFKFQGVLMEAARDGYRPNSFMNDLYAIQSQLPPKAQDTVFLSNHDKFTGNRVASQLGGDTAKTKLAASLYLLLSGNPSIYYGEEIGMKGEKTDENLRQPLDWKAIQSQADDENSILNHYRRLLKLRNTYDALRGGITYFAHAHYSSSDKWDNSLNSNGSKILAIIREWHGEKILVVHNLGNANEQIHVSLDSTNLSIPNGTPVYSLMGNAPVQPVSSSNRNWYDIGVVYPKCSKVLYFGDISKYKTTNNHFVTYENALQDGANSVTIHYQENHTSPAYFLHAWDDLGLAANKKVKMSYEGQFNGKSWWSVTMHNMPANFKFCFVDNANAWDGTNRNFTKQGSHIYTIAGSAKVTNNRP